MPPAVRRQGFSFNILLLLMRREGFSFFTSSNPPVRWHWLLVVGCTLLSCLLLLSLFSLFTDHRSPSSIFRLPSSDSRLLTSNFRLPSPVSRLRSLRAPHCIQIKLFNLLPCPGRSAQKLQARFKGRIVAKTIYRNPLT